MRLGQLARKTNIKAAEIVKTLSEELGVEIENNPNTKVSDEHVAFITKKYIEDNEPQHVEEVIAPVEKQEEDKPENIKPPEKIEPDEVEHIETIKPEALAGPKIIGKIDLPPPPPPEMVEVDGVMMEKKEALEKRKKERQRPARRAETPDSYPDEDKHDSTTKSSRFREKHDEYSFEKIKKQEEKKLLEKLKEKEKYEKEQKKAHYQQKHAPPVSGKKKEKRKPTVQIPESEDVEIPETTVLQKEEEKNLSFFQKIWKWFNT